MADLLRTLARTPFTVTVAGRAFRVSYRPASEWLIELNDAPLEVLAYRILGEDSDFLLRVADGDVTHEQARDAGPVILAEASGYDRWWQAYNLIRASAQDDVLGRMLLKGVDPARVTLGQWCTALYALAVTGAKESDKAKFDFQLDIPPAGYDPGDAWDDGYDPMAAAAAMPGMK